LEAKKSSDTDRTLPPSVSTVTSEDLARDVDRGGDIPTNLFLSWVSNTSSWIGVAGIFDELRIVEGRRP
jgi:hypothetical protein